MYRENTAKLGEEIASDFLEKSGYRIIERNYRSKFGEIDIIAKDRKTLCFIEVKTRKKNTKGSPEEAINLKKQKSISKSALDYLKRNNLISKSARFDVVSVSLDEFGNERIKLIKDAFYLDKRYLY